uniref:PAZ domain-containing protein n=1 Tax=Syphacia muris TaxID=451379 RepID=A0A0N5AC15_9BILA
MEFDRRDNTDCTSRKPDLEEAEKRLAEFCITSRKEELAKKQPPGTLGIEKVKILTNIYGIKLSSVRVFLYNVQVIGISHRDRPMELTKRSHNESAYHTFSFRKLVCFETFKKVKEDSIFTDKLVYYDGEQRIYAIGELKLTAPDYEHTFKIIVDEHQDFGEHFKCIDFTVKATLKSFTLNDMTTLLSGLETDDPSLVHFVEIATSQYLLSNQNKFVMCGGERVYLAQPLNHGFKSGECPNLSDGKHLSVGIRKSALVVEGPKGRGSCNAAVTVDSSKTAFHCAENVLDKAISICPELLTRGVDIYNLIKLRKQFNGLFAEKRHNGSKYVFQITEVSARSALEAEFEYEGSNMTIAEFFKKRYSLNLRF